MLGDLAPVLGVAILMGVIGWIIRTIVVNRRRHAIARIQADLQTRLLERFGSPQELLAYLDSPAGRRFVESATLERGNPFGRILGSVQAGIIVTAAGVAFLSLRGMDGLGSDGVSGFTFLGTLALALGLGFLASAAAAWALSRAWGLIDGKAMPDEP